MTNEELQAALLQAGGPAYYDVAADLSFVIIDGAFTLEDLAAMGDVALKAMSKPEAQVGAKIRLLVDRGAGRVGEEATLTRLDSGGDWWASNDRAQFLGLGPEEFEVIR